MKKIALRRTTLLLAALAAATSSLLLQTAPARAQFPRTWVSGTGSDSNTGTGCQPSAPCLSFSAALSVTQVGGEINCVSPNGLNGFGTPLNITSSVIIACHDVYGAIGANGTNAIVINAPGGIVDLRNLNFDGFNVASEAAGLTGVTIKAAAAVNVEDCVIENFSQSGITDQRTSGGGQLVIKNTVLRNNGSSSTSLRGGIHVVPGPGVTAQVSIDRSQITGNYFGIVADGTSGGTVKGTISDSVVSGNSEDGIAAISSGSAVWVLVDQTKIAGNAYGLAAGGSGAEILARNSSIFDNSTGLHTGNGGAIYTYGNNSVNGNATNGAFTGTVGLQ